MAPTSSSTEAQALAQHQAQARVSAVLDAEASRRQALLAADLRTLQALLGDDLVYVHSTGVRDSKHSYLAKLSTGGLKYLLLSFSDMDVRLLPQAAIVTGRMVAVVLKAGEERQVASLFMTVWCQGTDGRWRLQAHQGSAVPVA